MNIQEIEIEKLIPYHNNPRKDQAVDKVASSINEYGFQQPIVVDKNMVLIVGHTRLMGAKKLGLKKVPVTIANLSESKAKAYRIADNRLNEDSAWDFDLLDIEIKNLLNDDYNIDLLGFDSSELDKFLKNDEEYLTDEDEVPEPPKEPKSKIGDVYELGQHRLMCGDSIKFENLDILMNKKNANMVFTDPPYGVNYQSNMREKSKKFDIINNDDKLLDVCPTIEKYAKGWVFLWSSWKVIDKWIKNTEKLGFPTNIIIWNKGGGGIGDLKKTFSTDYEICLVFNREYELIGKRIGSVWTLKKDKATEYKHPTQKPVELAEEAILKTTKQNKIVLDIFGGSGSTLIACEKTKRKCYMMELDPKYVDVIIQRWENFTGKKAKKIN
tara:strand:+ start:412 stop:1560 length:1149 start_codon:yes stop_codon:yes gene_type:complete